MALRDRLSSIRDKVQRREKKIRSDRQAKSRRIEKENPEGFTEAVAVKGKKAKEAVGEAKKLGGDVSSLASTTFGGGAPKKGKELGERIGGAIENVDSGALNEPMDDSLGAGEAVSMGGGGGDGGSIEAVGGTGTVDPVQSGSGLDDNPLDAGLGSDEVEPVDELDEPGGDMFQPMDDDGLL